MNRRRHTPETLTENSIEWHQKLMIDPFCERWTCRANRLTITWVMCWYLFIAYRGLFCCCFDGFNRHSCLHQLSAAIGTAAGESVQDGRCPIPKEGCGMVLTLENVLGVFGGYIWYSYLMVLSSLEAQYQV